MIRTFSKSVSLRFCTVLEVKSKFGAEYRRFSVERYEPGLFKEFLQLLLCLHHLRHVEIFISYADIHGELLPINNDENFCRAVSTAQSLLRIFIQQREETDQGSVRPDAVKRQRKSAAAARGEVSRRRPQVQIGMPQNFRPVSSIIDVDILPECHRRVRLYSQGSDRPLGFYIRDGTTVRVTPHGLEKVPGIFISRLVPGGLAQSTGLLAINDQVLEVNGIDVMGKSLDQVTDMMVANSYNLIITVKPANQHNNAGKRYSCIPPSPQSFVEGKGSISYPGLPVIMRSHVWTGSGYESDEDSDFIVERPVKHPSQRSSASVTPQSSHSRAQDRYRCLGRHCSPDYCRSQPSLNHMIPPEPSTPLHREMTQKHHYRSSPAFRQSTSSTQDILSMLRSDIRQRLMVPQAAMEEDGIVIFL